MRLPKLAEGQVWISLQGRHRRIIDITKRVVTYSVGGDHNHSCKSASFRRWLYANEVMLQGGERVATE